MKCFKYVFTIFLCTIMVGVFSTQAFAAKTDITYKVSAKEKKKMQNMASFFRAVALGLDNTIDLKNYSSNKKINSMKLDFSKVTGRKTALKYMGMLYMKISMSKLSMQGFGVNTSIKRQSGDAPGESSVQVKRIYKTGKKNCYLVTANVYLCSWENDVKVKIGSMQLFLRKKPGSHYGYVASSMKYTKAK